METPLPLTLTQLLIVIIIAILIAAGIAVLIFSLGLGSGFILAGAGRTPQTGAFALTPTMPPLPKAVTATPKDVDDKTQTFTFTEEMLNEMLSGQSSSEIPIVVDDVTITEETVTLSGAIDYGGIRGNIQVTAIPYVSNQRVRFDLVSINLEGQPLPELIYPTVEEQVNLFFDQLLTGYDVQSLVLEDGQMTVTVVAW